MRKFLPLTSLACAVCAQEQSSRGGSEREKGKAAERARRYTEHPDYRPIEGKLALGEQEQ